MTQDAAIITHGTAPHDHGGSIDANTRWLIREHQTREPFRHQATHLDARTILADIHRRIGVGVFMLVVPGEQKRAGGRQSRSVAAISGGTDGWATEVAADVTG